ncbi:MAG TPA: SRPBCC family protein [Candidatus Omnitrophota bacterium]|nr:SRPBCC family protein [Candidatus Omnitrophota bacterium]HPS36710.1 SRPBCC family protein [Candidatus Omnitrophota bacterium]
MVHPEGEFVISTSRVLPAKRWQVLRLLTRVEDYPAHLPEIKECQVLSRTRTESLTFWKIEMGSLPVVWKEEAFFDYRHFTINFNAVEGDLERFSGVWKLHEHPLGGTEIFIEATVKIGIPILEQAMGGVLADKVLQYFERLLQVFEELLTAQSYRRRGSRHVRQVGGFGVIGHPYNYEHLVRYFQSYKKDSHLPSREFLTKIFELTPSYVSYDIREFRAASGKTTDGAFIACNIIPEMLGLDIEKVVGKVVESCKVAEKLGLGVVALGGFTSIAGERYGEEFLKRIHIPVTTGNTLTAALAVEGVLKAARLRELDLSKVKATVIGGSGDIGSACARALVQQVKEVTITGRTPRNIDAMVKNLQKGARAKVRGSRNNDDAVKDADIVIAAASAAHSIVDIEKFKPGAIICDVGYPKNIAYADTDRTDILIFAGGICSLPCEFNAGFDVGLPSPKVLYGCFSEAIVLALEERFENYSWGKGNISLEKMAEILALARKNGFEIAPFFWGHRQVSDEEIRASRISAS